MEYFNIHCVLSLYVLCIFYQYFLSQYLIYMKKFKEESLRVSTQELIGKMEEESWNLSSLADKSGESRVSCITSAWETVEQKLQTRRGTQMYENGLRIPLLEWGLQIREELLKTKLEPNWGSKLQV